MYNVKEENRDAEYTTVDLNATGTTTVYDATKEASVYGVYMETLGSSAVAGLESTDGTSIAVLDQPGAGNNLAFGDPIAIDEDDTLQVNVTTANTDGIDGNTTAVVYRGEQAYTS